ncbi:MAG TPA: DUF3667 domain-containing protein [Chitinophagaceae bacterium]
MSHIKHDVIHAVTHADRGFLFTIKELVINPGRVAREYVQGKRKKYFNPFSFLIIIIGILLIANSIFKPYSRPGESVSKTPPSTMRSEQGRKKYAEILERSRNFGEFMNKRTNLVLFVSTPFIAAVLWLIFRRRGLNYAEHLAAMAYVNGFLNLLTSFIYGPLLYFSRGTYVFTGIYAMMMLSHVFYVGYLYHGFLGYTHGRDYWKTIGGGLLAILAWAALSMGVGMYYIRYGF